MKIFMFMAAVALTAFVASASGDIRFKPVAVSDPMYEWMQYDENDMSCKLKKDALVMENKSEKLMAYTFTEIPVNVAEEDFVVSMAMLPSEISDDKPVGVIFNYRNEKNYDMMTLGEKNFYVSECIGGEKALIVKGLYKILPFGSDMLECELGVKGDKKTVVLTLKKDGGKLNILVNGLPMCSVKNKKLEYPTFGFIVGNKGKLVVYGLEYGRVIADETEE